MKIRKVIINYIKRPSQFFNAFIIKYARIFNHTELLVKKLYKNQMGKDLNIKYPSTFNEKIQWLKLNDHNPLYHNFVDKYEVKEYITRIIGKEYVIPTLGVYNTYEEIDFNKLPNQFVLKTTSGGGNSGVAICKNKSTFNFEYAKKMLEQSMKFDIYKMMGEWSYRGIKPRIIAEKYMEDSSINELRDYKFFCFNGTPFCFKVDFDRTSNHRANYYDLEGNLLPFGEVVCPPNIFKEIIFPNNLEDMILISKKLSNNIPFVRVDLYNVDGNIFFGEMTFYPASGFGQFQPSEWDYKLGNLLNLKIN